MLETAAAEVEGFTSIMQQDQDQQQRQVVRGGTATGAQTGAACVPGSAPAGGVETDAGVDAGADFGWAFKLTSGVWQRKYFAVQGEGSKRLCFFEDAEQSKMKGVMDLRRVKSVEPVEATALVAEGAANALPPDGCVCFDIVIGDKFTRTYHVAVDNAKRAHWIESLLQVAGRSAAAVMTVDTFVDLRSAESGVAEGAERVFAKTMGASNGSDV